MSVAGTWLFILKGGAREAGDIKPGASRQPETTEAFTVTLIVLG